ncbi:MAG: hypothetical protein M3N46_06830 [Actinomycetota bacterium]|nr:hypothetical protein [Actinomycetota bacterium]
MTDPDTVLGLEPDDLDGHTIDELEDYLEQGRSPANPSIDNSPACQIALNALQRLNNAARALLDPSFVDSHSDDDWIASAITRISFEARTGRRFPIPPISPDLDATVTEGALRGLIRAIGDALPGILTGAVHIDTDDHTGTAGVRIDIAVIYGHPIGNAIRDLRAVLTRVLPDHVPFDLDRIDIRVVDVLDLRIRGHNP